MSSHIPTGSKAPSKDEILNAWLVYKKICDIDADIAFARNGRISVLTKFEGELEYIINNMAPTNFLIAINTAATIAQYHKQLHPLAKYAVEEGTCLMEMIGEAMTAVA